MSSVALSANTVFNQLAGVVMFAHNNAIRVHENHLETVDWTVATQRLGWKDLIRWSLGYGPLGYHTLNSYIEKKAIACMQYLAAPFVEHIQKVKAGKILEIPVAEFIGFQKAMTLIDQTKAMKEESLRKIDVCFYERSHPFFKTLLVVTLIYEKIKNLYCVWIRRERPPVIPYFSSIFLDAARSLNRENDPFFNQPYTIWTGKMNENTFHFDLFHNRCCQQLKLYRNNIYIGHLIFFLRVEERGENEISILAVSSYEAKGQEAEHLFGHFLHNLLRMPDVQELDFYKYLPPFPKAFMKRTYERIPPNEELGKKLDALNSFYIEEQELFSSHVPLTTLLKAVVDL